MEVLGILAGIMILIMFLLFFWPIMMGSILALVMLYIAAECEYETTFKTRFYLFISGTIFLAGLVGQIHWFYHL